jgi:hypothetical protein
MSAAREHPRLASAISAALVLLALTGVGAGDAFGGAAQPGHTTSRVVRVADARVAALDHQLQAAQVLNVQLRGRVGTLQTRLACLQVSRRLAARTVRSKRRRRKR